MQLLVVLSTFPDKDTAQRVAHALVVDGHAACVTLLPGVQSTYRWEENIEAAAEVLAIMKTTAMAYPGLEAKLKEVHPYKVPEIIAVPVERVEEAYAKWVNDCVAPM
jgi:periplasmic divalent cation tolerance protein